LNEQYYLDCSICHNQFTLIKDEYELKKGKLDMLATEWHCNTYKQDMRLLFNKEMIGDPGKTGIICMWEIIEGIKE
jgi:hypothetical protein